MTHNGTKILIIDDDPFFQTIIADAFKENGFTVFVAADGVEGVKLYQDRLPDVVISDLVMPRMGGVSTCMEISRIAGERQPVIIMLTSMFQRALGLRERGRPSSRSARVSSPICQNERHSLVRPVAPS